MFPRLDLLFLMDFGVGLHAIRAKWFQTIDINAEIGNLFSGVL